jgi:ketosteroid isomerase-like protein
MKTRSLLVLVGLALCFALPVLAQENDRVGPETRQQIEVVLKMREEAINKNDAATVAALYTQDATSIRSWESEGGLASGRQAIEGRYATELALSPGEFVDKLARVCPAGSEMCAISEGSWGLWKGYYVRIYVWDADSWKIRVEYVIFGRR